MHVNRLWKLSNRSCLTANRITVEMQVAQFVRGPQKIMPVAFDQHFVEFHSRANRPSFNAEVSFPLAWYRLAMHGFDATLFMVSDCVILIPVGLLEKWLLLNSRPKSSQLIIDLHSLWQRRNYRTSQFNPGGFSPACTVRNRLQISVADAKENTDIQSSLTYSNSRPIDILFS